MPFFTKKPLSIRGKFGFSFYYTICRKLETYFNSPIITTRAFSYDVKFYICSTFILTDAWNRGS